MPHSLSSRSPFSSLLSWLSYLSGRPSQFAALLYVLVWLRRKLRRPRISYPHLKLQGCAVKEGGRLVPLSHGVTHYILDGHENGGSLVVLVHGFVGSTAYLQPLAEYLVVQGRRRVLRLDLYGRGFSECRGAAHTADLFAGQIAELLFSLGEVEPVHLLGYSMGGAAAARFAACFPERVRSLTLVAAVGMPSMRRNIPAYLGVALRLPFLRPLIGWIVRRGAKGRGDTASQWVVPSGERFEEQLAIQRERMDREPAIARSVASSLAHMPWGEMTDDFEAIADHAFPVLIVWGSDDGTVPATGADEMKSIVPRARVVVMPGQKHCIAIEAAEQVGDEMLEAWRIWQQEGFGGSAEDGGMVLMMDAGEHDTHLYGGPML